MAVRGLSQLLIDWLTKRETVVSGVRPVVTSCVAVDTGELAISVRYQMLFVPPDALKVMGRFAHIDSGVPVLVGALGRAYACALVPRDGRLSQPSFRQVAV